MFSRAGTGHGLQEQRSMVSLGPRGQPGWVHGRTSQGRLYKVRAKEEKGRLEGRLEEEEAVIPHASALNPGGGRQS